MQATRRRFSDCRAEEQGIVEQVLAKLVQISTDGWAKAVDADHLREKEGRREVDVIAELPPGDVVAIEIKASSAPSAADGRHLIWLRDVLGVRFLAGAVLHTGPRPFRLAERVLALPICALWD